MLQALKGERGAVSLQENLGSMVVVIAIIGASVAGLPAFFGFLQDRQAGADLGAVSTAETSALVTHRTYLPVDQLDIGPLEQDVRVGVGSAGQCFFSAATSNSGNVIVSSSEAPEGEWSKLSRMPESWARCLGTEGTVALVESMEGADTSAIPAGLPAPPPAPVVSSPNSTSFTWPLAPDTSYEVSTSPDGRTWTPARTVTDPGSVTVAPRVPVTEPIDHPATRNVGIQVTAVTDSGKSLPAGPRSAHVPGQVNMAVPGAWQLSGGAVLRGGGFVVGHGATISQTTDELGVDDTVTLWLDHDQATSYPTVTLRAESPTGAVIGNWNARTLRPADFLSGGELRQDIPLPDGINKLHILIEGQGQRGNGSATTLTNLKAVVHR